MRYRDIVERCLELEDKAHRDQVLAQYPDQAPGARIIMAGLARKLATGVCFAGMELPPGGRRRARKAKLESINPPWLRARVEAMVREQFPTVRERLKARDFDRLKEAVQ